jgi:glutamate 5-kinase
MHDRKRYLNARTTIHALLDLGVIPIINENDTISTEEIRFGDNDNLSAQVAMMIDADLLIILSDVDGFYVREANTKKVMYEIAEINAAVRGHVHGVTRETTVGGMASKLDTAALLMRLGIPLIIANGNKKNTLTDIMAGKQNGTFFIPHGKKIDAKKRWLAFRAAHKKAGSIVVDDGAYQALSANGKSLLPSGVKDVKGTFVFGDAVNLLTQKGEVFAKGIANFSSEDVCRIMGKRTTEIKTILGEERYTEVVNRDNLIIIR